MQDFFTEGLSLRSIYAITCDLQYLILLINFWSFSIAEMSRILLDLMAI